MAEVLDRDKDDLRDAVRNAEVVLLCRLARGFGIYIRFQKGLM